MDTKDILKEVRKEITRLQAIERLLEGSSAPMKGKRKKMSKAARQKISDAQNARWAKVREQKKKAAK